MFRIDGEKVSFKAFNELVKQYNIHVDNLCMFLPQDRVQDFTKLNPQEILASTQSSVCSQDINDIFEQLKEKRDTQKNLTRNNNEIAVQLDDHINRNNQLHSMIENSKLKDQMVKDCEMYKKKLAWIEYDQIKVQYNEATEDIKKLNESINSKKELLKPLEKRQSEIAGTKKNLQESITKTNTLMVQYNKDIDNLMDTTFKLESEIGLTKQNFRNVVANAKTLDKDLKEHEILVNCDKNELAEAQAKLNEQGDYEGKRRALEKQYRGNQAQMEKLMQEMENINRTVDESITPEINSCKRKLENMNDVNLQRFNILRQNFEETFAAYQWLDQNRHTFRSHIFNPIITEITITEKKYAKYVENIISNRDLLSFLCTNKDDMRDLIVKFRNELNLQVSVGYTEPDEMLRYQPNIEINSTLKNLGLYAYALDVIEGPAPVLNYLCRLYNIHNTAIGNDKTYKCASQIPQSINLFFSTNHRFLVNISAYTGNKSSSCSEIHPRNILNIGIDQTLVEQEQNR